MKAQLLIDILCVNPEGEVYIVDWDKQKEVTVQINHLGQFELKIDGAFKIVDESTPALEEKAITIDEVRAVLAEKNRDGHRPKVRKLLQKYGANKLSEVKAADYPAILAEAEVIGNGWEA